MRDRLASSVPLGRAPGVRVLESLEHRPVGTNGYVSTWGALVSVSPPKGR
ncbi:hypothetical protein [Spirillospora sp. NPDC048819]